MPSSAPTILVVEDDEETLNVICRTLASGGYDVMWARNAQDATKLLTRQEYSLALLVIDVVLPGLSGPAVAEQILAKYPAADVIYVSAYDEETVRSHGVDPAEVPFLAKPYEPDDLLRVVRDALQPA